jgi:hypothetical protein
MPTKPDITAITLSLRLAKVQALVQEGKLDEAEALLAPYGKLPETSLELEMLACVVTSMQDYPRALRLWKILQQRMPGHEQAERMVPVLEDWTNRPFWYAWVPIGGAILASCLVLGLILWAFGGSSQSVPAQVVSKPTPSPFVSPSAGQNNPAYSRPATYPAPAARTPVPNTEPEPTISLSFPAVKPSAKPAAKPAKK